MRIALPNSEDMRSRLMLSLHVEDGLEPSRLQNEFPFPIADIDGELLIHASGLWVLAKLDFCRGYADAETRDWCGSYLAECRRTFDLASKTEATPKLMAHFKALLTDEWKPKKYQVAGMATILRRFRFGSGVILGDDVGLGKTIVGIGVMSHLFAKGEIGSGPGRCAAIVTEVATKSQWKDEIARFAKFRPAVSLVESPDGQSKLNRLKQKADVYILNYELLRLPKYKQACLDLNPRLVILDETYKIASPASATYAATREFIDPARFRVAFNATPIENGLADMFTQTKACDRNCMGDYGTFESRYIRRVAGPGTKVVGYTHVEEFRRRAAMVCFRRTHAECGSEVPSVRASIRPCVMSPKQWAAYRAACGECIAGVHKGAIAMEKISAVRYAAFAEDILNPASDSCKCDDLEFMLEGELKGQQVVVFSRYRRVIEFAARRLARLKPWSIHGGVSASERSDIRRRFASAAGRGKVLLGTSAMERGGNYQTAGVLWNLDLPWNPGKLRQRVGRIARIGQTRKHVLVLNSRAVGPKNQPSIDDWFIRTVLPDKRAIFDQVFGKDGVDELGVVDERPDPEGVIAYLRQLQSATR